MVQELRSFLTKSNALALAVGVIIDAATGKVVSAIVDDLLMPVIGLVLASGACPECLEVVPQAARRCHACGSALSEAPEGSLTGV